ncbi:MAG: hypothetical protein IT473_14560 [Lysobacter sp.]|nr:hypothetical protein [Lysobacter sp.]
MNDQPEMSKKAQELYELARNVAEVRVGSPLSDELDRKLKAWAQTSAVAEAARMSQDGPAGALRRNAAKAIDEHRARNDAMLRDVLAMPTLSRGPREDQSLETFAAVIGAAHRRLSSAEPTQPAPEGSRERKIADLGDGLIALLRFEVDRYVQQTFGPLAERLHAVVDSVQKQVNEKRAQRARDDASAGDADAKATSAKAASAKPAKRDADDRRKRASKKKFTRVARER